MERNTSNFNLDLVAEPKNAPADSSAAVPTNKEKSPRLDQLLSESQAAKYLGVPLDIIHSWRDAGIGPVHVRFGTSVRYQRRDLIAFLALLLTNPKEPSKPVASTGEVKHAL
jgi:hypothetical protein